MLPRAIQNVGSNPYKILHRLMPSYLQDCIHPIEAAQPVHAIWEKLLAVPNFREMLRVKLSSIAFQWLHQFFGTASQWPFSWLTSSLPSRSCWVWVLTSSLFHLVEHYSVFLMVYSLFTDIAYYVSFLMYIRLTLPEIHQNLAVYKCKTITSLWCAI